MFIKISKKECAACRHPIETRRLLREDTKIKEISNYYNLFRRLIFIIFNLI